MLQHTISMPVGNKNWRGDNQKPAKHQHKFNKLQLLQALPLLRVKVLKLFAHNLRSADVQKHAHGQRVKHQIDPRVGLVRDRDAQEDERGTQHVERKEPKRHLLHGVPCLQKPRSQTHGGGQFVNQHRRGDQQDVAPAFGGTQNNTLHNYVYAQGAQKHKGTPAGGRVEPSGCLEKFGLLFRVHTGGDGDCVHGRFGVMYGGDTNCSLAVFRASVGVGVAGGGLGVGARLVVHWAGGVVVVGVGGYAFNEKYEVVAKHDDEQAVWVLKVEFSLVF